MKVKIFIIFALILSLIPITNVYGKWKGPYKYSKNKYGQTLGYYCVQNRKKCKWILIRSNSNKQRKSKQTYKRKVADQRKYKRRKQDQQAYRRQKMEQQRKEVEYNRRKQQEYEYRRRIDEQREFERRKQQQEHEYRRQIDEQRRFEQKRRAENEYKRRQYQQKQISFSECQNLSLIGAFLPAGCNRYESNSSMQTSSCITRCLGNSTTCRLSCDLGGGTNTVCYDSCDRKHNECKKGC